MFLLGRLFFVVAEILLYALLDNGLLMLRSIRLSDILFEVVLFSYLDFKIRLRVSSFWPRSPPRLIHEEEFPFDFGFLDSYSLELTSLSIVMFINFF